MRLLAFLLALVAAGAGRAQAYPSGEDVAQIQAAIARQIDSPCVPDVRPTLRRPLNLAFLGLVVLGDEVVQEVRLTDRRGSVWLGYYAMQRQHDGRWRMNGCRLAQPARAIPA